MRFIRCLIVKFEKSCEKLCRPFLCFLFVFTILSSRFLQRVVFSVLSSDGQSPLTATSAINDQEILKKFLINEMSNTRKKTEPKRKMEKVKLGFNLFNARFFLLLLLIQPTLKILFHRQTS